MACVLAESELLYGAHGISFFTLSCALVDGKKRMVPPKNWQSADPSALKAKRKNAVCIRTGYTDGAACPLVVIDADGADAIAVVERLLAETCAGFNVPQVQTQRGATGRHYYFRSTESGLAATLKSGAKLVIAGVQTNVDVRAGSKGEGIGCILAPPTAVVGGGRYMLLPGPAIHEAPAMPDALAVLLGAHRGGPTHARHPPAAVTNGTGESTTGPARDTATKGTGESTGHEMLMAAALRDAAVRAGSANVGTPVRVVCDSGHTARVEFTHRVSRVCPVSHQEHRSNHFNVTLRLDERTGLAALFVFCHSEKEGCKGHGHRMLGFLDAEEAAALCAESGIDASAHCAAVPPTLGQAAVAIGEAQKSLDRLLENPNGPWATVESLSVVACALCTAAGGHAHMEAHARLMLGAVLDGTQLTGAERGLVERAFQVAKVPMDPIATLRGFAAGLNGKREQELMLVREAIVACTDPTLEADVPRAAEAMLVVLEYCERRDETTGRIEKLGNIADLGLFLYFVWRRVARYGFDDTQSSEAHQWMFYLFNGATYERGQMKQISIQAKKHVRAIIKALSGNVQLRTRAMSLEVKCNTSDFIARGLAEMQMSFMDIKQLAECGLVSPEAFELEMDMGNYIGFTNGVYDILNDRFMPKGRVPLNVLVSLSTNYAYVPPDDPRFPEMRAQIEELYRTLHAEDYNDPNDERLAAMWLLSGSLLFRGNVCKKAYIFLGSEGDNGKSKFSEFIQLTLGKYAATGNRTALSGPEQGTLDPDMAANHRVLVVTYPEMQSIENGVSVGFRFNDGKLKTLTGQDAQIARGLFRDPKERIIANKPILHSNYMPQVDSGDSAAKDRLWVARFGSTFPPGLTEKDVARRRYPRIENLRDRMKEWAPFHFLLMIEALRDFRRCNCVLPPGAQQIEGSLMHQAAAAQAPEGKLRTWVEDNYAHVPLREKDTGTKLEVLYAAYTLAAPPVHAKVLGKILFGKMLNAVFPHVGPHKNTASSASLYLLR
jgi:hypothetical protein